MFLRQGLQFGVSVVLARVLSPEEFGTIALIYLLMGVATAFVDSGLSAALIRDQEITEADKSTVFWLNLGIGLGMALAMGACARAVARFYGIPVLVPLTWAMAANVAISALGAIHGTLLTKELNFRVQMKIGLAAAVVSGAAAIAMARAGYGVWALAAQVLVSSACTTVLLWFAHDWRPSARFSLDSARRLFRYGGYLLSANLLDILYRRFYTVLIGKMFGTRELGFYGRADSTQQVPVSALTGVLSRVALPIFSVAAKDPEKLRRGVRLSVRGMMLVNVPMMLGLAAVAEPATVALVGEKWLPMAPILQVLCLSGVFWPLHVINLNVLKAQGHSNLFFRLEVIKKVLGLALLAGGAYFGPMGIAWSTVAFGVLAFGVNAFYSQKLLGYGALAQAADCASIMLLSIAMYAVVRTVSVRWSPGPVMEVVSLSSGGLLIFLAFGFLFRVRVFRDVIELLGSRRRSARVSTST